MAKFYFKSYKFRSMTKPNTTLQIINNFKPFEEKYFNKKSIANKEDKNAVTRPTIRGGNFSNEKSLKKEINSTTAAKEIAGIPKRKDNFTASFLSHPVIRAVEIVTPDLETPGKMAKDCERPIKKLSAYVWFFKLIEPFLEHSAIYMKIAIRKETNAIDKFERRILSKK